MIYVSYDKRKRRLVVECSYIDNGIVKQFPSRKFETKSKSWLVPMCLKNAEYLEKIADKCDITDEAKKAIGEHMVKVSVPPALPFPVSYPYKTTPFDHQRTALNLCWNRDVFALFMEMGTGKSKVAVDKSACHFFNGEVNAMIVFCPVSIRYNWVEQLKAHCPIDLKWQTISGEEWWSPYVKVVDLGSKATERDLDQFITTPAPFKVLIVGMESIQAKSAIDNPGNAGRVYEFVERFALTHSHMQVVDEGHNIKSHESNRTVNITLLGHMAKYKLFMTGTPILQGLLDLYAYFEYLNPNIIGIGDFYSFRNRYAILSEDGYKRVVSYDNVEELLSAVQPYIYQVKKSECLDLPDKVYTTRVVKLSTAQQEVYDAIKKIKLYEKGDVKVVIDNALQKYSALQTIVGGFINYDKAVVGPFSLPVLDEEGNAKTERTTMPIVDWKGNPKIKELLSCLAEIDDSESVIIWAVHTYEIRDIRDALEHRYGDGCVAEFHGGVSPEQRENNKRDFNSRRKRFWLANQAAGGVGLTLNEAAYVFYMSNTFKLKDRLQSEDRNHRIGQTRSVLYTTIVAANTVDIDIMRSIHDKKDFADWVRDQFADGSREALTLF